MDWFNTSITLLNKLLDIWQDERRTYYIRKKNQFLKDLNDEEAKPIYDRNQNYIDHIHRELLIICEIISAESIAPKR